MPSYQVPSNFRVRLNDDGSEDLICGTQGGKDFIFSMTQNEPGGTSLKALSVAPDKTVAGLVMKPVYVQSYAEVNKSDLNVTPAVLFSHTFPAGSLKAGDAIEINGLFSFPNSATVKKLRASLGGIAIMSYDASTSQAFEWRTKTRLRSLTAQVSFATGSSSGGFGVIAGSPALETAIDFNNAVTLEVTAEWGTAGTGTNNISFECVDVQVLRAMG
jgi:hypothetical protein